MTVSSGTNRVSYSGNGTLTTFAYSFKVFDQDDLTVILRASDGTETTQTITTNYTVTGVGDVGGGNVVFGTAPASGVTVVILREQPLTQGLDLVPNDPFPANSLEESLDKLTFITQQHSEELSRTIKASKTNTITGAEFTISAADRANKIFAFDGSGDVSITQAIGVYRGDWSASVDYNPRDIVKDTDNDNIYIANTAHTSSGALPLSSNADIAKWDLLVDAAAAAASAAAAAASETAAQTAETNAETAQTAAETARTGAETAKTAAETAQSAAETAKTAAETAETGAQTAESNASTSETNAATSETNAATSASAASTSATNAATSESNASTSESNAATSATTATNQAGAAATSATNAATSETNASTSETNAATSATNAATSETNAATSASAASASQIAAAASAASAATAYDSFDDRYLGTKASDPTVDNDGNALVSGALYFNSTANEMRVYDGGNWIAASSAGGASLLNYNYTATASQTTFSGADDNAATLSYTTSNLIVTLNGIVLEDGTDYTASNGTSIVLSSGAAAGDELNVVAFKSFTTADMVPASTGGTFSGAVTASAGLTVDNDGATVLTVDRATSDGPVIDVQKNGSTVGSIGTNGGNPYFASGSVGLKLTTEVLPVDNNGASADGFLDLGGASERFNNLYLSGGVYLGGTGSANKLDDYERGTWTPTFEGSISNPSVTYSNRKGSYTKIGNYVIAFWDMAASSMSGGSGQAQVTGLPFSAAVNSDNMAGYGVPQFRSQSAMPSTANATDVLNGYIENNIIYMEIENSGSAGYSTRAPAPMWTTGRSTGYMVYTTS